MHHLGMPPSRIHHLVLLTFHREAAPAIEADGALDGSSRHPTTIEVARK